MKYLKLSILAIATAAFVFACSTPATNSPSNTAANKPANTPANAAPANSTSNASTNSAPADELASAKKIYSEKCVRCHKEDGKGGQVDIEGTKLKVPDFTTDRMKKDKDEDFIDAIDNGIADEGMPAFKGKIPDGESKKLVALIRRDFQK